MATKLFVGSLLYSTTQEQLESLFSQVGKVESVSIITDRETGRSKGFGFVEMSTEEEANAAIEKFNNYEMREEGEGGKTRNITVSIARPREERPPRTGGYNNDRGGNRFHRRNDDDSYNG